MIPTFLRYLYIEHIAMDVWSQGYSGVYSPELPGTSAMAIRVRGSRLLILGYIVIPTGDT
jgi:hypothetical protein